MSQRFYSPNQQFADDTGLPYAGGLLFFYATGTSTPQNTYSDPGLTTPNTNPIVLDSAGRAGSVFLGPNAYKVVLEDALANQIWTEDPVQLSSTNGLFIDGVTTGDANDQVIATLSPTGFSLVQGYQINAVAGFTNTGPTTLNAVSTGAVAIYKASSTGPVPLVGGELIAGMAFSVIYDGTHYLLLNPAPIGSSIVSAASALAGSTINMIGSSGGGVPTASWNTFQIAMMTGAAPFSTFVGTNITLNFNTTVTGAGGMDVAGTAPGHTFVDVYAITKGDGVNFATLGSTATGGAPIYTGANMPAGYIASCLIGSFLTDGGGNFAAFYQRDRSIAIAAVQALANGAAASWSPLSIASIVPPNAASVSGELFTDTTANQFGLTRGDVSGSPGGVGAQWTGHNAGNAGAGGNVTQTYSSFAGVLITGQTLYYQVPANVGNGLSIWISGYTF